MVFEKFPSRIKTTPTPFIKRGGLGSAVGRIFNL